MLAIGRVMAAFLGATSAVCSVCPGHALLPHKNKHEPSILASKRAQAQHPVPRTHTPSSAYPNSWEMFTEVGTPAAIANESSVTMDPDSVASMRVTAGRVAFTNAYVVSAGEEAHPAGRHEICAVVAGSVSQAKGEMHERMEKPQFCNLGLVLRMDGRITTMPQAYGRALKTLATSRFSSARRGREYNNVRQQIEAYFCCTNRDNKSKAYLCDASLNAAEEAKVLAGGVNGQGLRGGRGDVGAVRETEQKLVPGEGARGNGEVVHRFE